MTCDLCSEFITDGQDCEEWTLHSGPYNSSYYEHEDDEEEERYSHSCHCPACGRVVCQMCE